MASSSGLVREEVARSLPGGAERGASVSPSEASTDQRFPRSCRITARRHYRTVYAKGLKTHRPSLTIFGMRNEVGHCRIGLTVTRKVGGAVSRNRVKRVLRDVFRRNRDVLNHPMDLVVNARPVALRRGRDQLEQELLDGVGELMRRMDR